jgi:ribose transport system ATP-binding protein
VWGTPRRPADHPPEPPGAAETVSGVAAVVPDAPMNFLELGAMAAASLELRGISKRYLGVQALSDVTFECRPGEVHAVLGENGSGKSTLLGIASGSIAADEGRVTIMGEALTNADPMLARRLGLGAVYQDNSLIEELTIADNLVLGALDDQGSSRRRLGWAQSLLDRFDLGFSADSLVGDLNPAQKQFLEIVKALANNPSVLLLDEPTSTLDYSGVEKLSGIVERIVAGGAAVVYVSHRLPEILALADRVTILRDGVSHGTYAVDARLSESDLVALMVGLPINRSFPANTNRRRGKSSFPSKTSPARASRAFRFALALEKS